MSEKSDRLRSARIKAGIASAAEAAQRLGVPAPSYTHHENGTRDFDNETGKMYARRLGVEAAWLILGEKSKLSVSEHQAARVAHFFDNAFADRTVVPEGQEFDPDPEFDPDAGTAVAKDQPYKSVLPGATPEIDVKPGAGLGTMGQTFDISSKAITTGHRVVNEWVLPPNYMRHELGARPSAVVIMEVIGDSMLGTLDPGDRILVDTSQNTFGPDAVYVIDDGDGEPRVKRLEKVLFSDPPAVAIISDNPAAKQVGQAALDRIRIVGRVVGRLSRM